MRRAAALRLSLTRREWIAAYAALGRHHRADTLRLRYARDRLCPVNRMDAVIASLKSSWRMHWIEGADHSFKVLKRSGRSDAEVIDEIGSTTERWMRSLAG
jgi:predicted alpha/beta-hydrolase family hydrolase